MWIFGTVHRPKLPRPGYKARQLEQRELCDRHAAWLKANRLNVLDLRGAPDGLTKTVKRRLSL